MKPKDEKAWEELMGFPLSESALNIDVGTSLTPEEKRALWPSEERIDIIGSNGNDGLVYDIGGDIYEVD